MNTKIKIDERVRKLVMTIGGEVVPRRQLIADLGLRQESRRNFYRNYMYPARDRGLVVMEYSDVPSKPEQAYKLTEKGLIFWAELKQAADNERAKKEQVGQGDYQVREWGFKKGTGWAGRLSGESG